MLYLSYTLNKNTPSYGNRNQFKVSKQSDISQGAVANDSTISTTVHIGTHIDMPYHFYSDGQTIEDFNIDFFAFEHVLYIDFEPSSLIIGDELITLLKEKKEKEKYTMLVVKTGICNNRESSEFWENNYGFDPKIAVFLREFFPNIRVLGFDSISVSSFSHRIIGREAHKAFLDPKNPILLLEDMDLRKLNKNTEIKELIIAPLRISKCDGLPCTVIAKI